MNSLEPAVNMADCKRARVEFKVADDEIKRAQKAMEVVEIQIALLEIECIVAVHPQVTN